MQDRHPTSCHPSPFLAPPWQSPSPPWPSAPQAGSPPLFGLGKECRLLCRNNQRQPRSILRNLGNYFHEQMDKIKLKEYHGTHNNPLKTLLWTHSIILGYVSKFILNQCGSTYRQAKRCKKIEGFCRRCRSLGSQLKSHFAGWM